MQLGERLSFRERSGLVLAPLVFIGLGLGATSLPTASRWALASAAAMAVLWVTEAIPLWVTALLPLVLFPALSGANFGRILLQYFDPVNFLFLGGMWIAASLEEWNVHHRLALGTVARLGTSPRRIVLGFMLATTFISLWISNTAAALMVVPIAVSLIEHFRGLSERNSREFDRFATALMLAVGYAASIGGIGCKIGTGTNLVFVKQSAELLGHDVSFVAWFKVGLPVVLLVTPLAWLYLVRIAAPISGEPIPGARALLAERRAALGRMVRGEKIALTAFIGAALLWTFRQPMDFGLFGIPGWSMLIPNRVSRVGQHFPEPLRGLFGPRGAEGLVALSIAAVLFVIPAGQGRRGLGLRAATRISWGLLALLGGGFAMAEGLSASGFTRLLAEKLGSVGNVPPLLALMGICLLTTALSEIASNTASASILLPVLATIAPKLGLSPATAMFAATLAASFGLMLPAGTPPNAVVFASGYIPVLKMVKAGFFVDLLGSLLIAVVCYFLAPWALG